MLPLHWRRYGMGCVTKITYHVKFVCVCVTLNSTFISLGRQQLYDKDILLLINCLVE